jgi:hypothetical protein
MLLIIIAHINAPYFLTVFRCFDVPLMVFVSGLCYGMKPLGGSIIAFYKKRIFRLIIPTWLFLFVLFSIEWMIRGALDIDAVLKSFFFYYKESYFSYMWIIKVFLLIMLITPLLVQIISKCSYVVIYLIILGLILLEELVAIPLCTAQFGGLLFEETIPYLLGYTVFFILGMLTKSYNDKEETKQLIVGGIICISIFIVWFVFHGGLPINDFKYPPQLLFILYGCIMPLVIWKARKIFKVQNIENMSNFSKYSLAFLVFVGQNTLWLYLWHIPFVLIANKIIVNFILRYVFVLLLTVLVTKIQVHFAEKYESKNGFFKYMSYLKG